MKANLESLSIIRNRVTVKVVSLNQAYTNAVLRLRPDQQSHRGRTYDALSWIEPWNQQISLGDIRDDVES